MMITLLILYLAFAVAQVLATAPCPLPSEVSPSKYPAGWVRSGDLQLSNDGTADWFSCASNYFIAQLGADSTPFATQVAFRCNTTSERWTTDSGFDAPPLLNCVQPPSGFVACPAKLTEVEGAWSGEAEILYLQGQNLGVCPSGQVSEYTTGNFGTYTGRAVSSINCRNVAGNRLVTNILCYGAQTTWPNSGDIATIKCVDAYCQVRRALADGTKEPLIFHPGDDVWSICPIDHMIYWYDNTVLATIECSPVGIKTTDSTGKAWNYMRCESPDLKCVPATCPIKNKKSDGTLEDKIITARQEQYCHSGTKMKLGYGASVKDIKCERLGLKITVEDGSVVEYQKTSPPTLECVATCKIKNHPSSGAPADLILEPGKEDFCPSGEIASYQDGTPISDLRCTTDGLEIHGEDGETKSYPNDNPAKLKCGPGVCTRTCSGPTTTTSTTTVATTTTVSPNCPDGGVWSEWVVTGSCSATCGSCGVATRTRECSTKCGNCPCVGVSEDVGPCGIKMCTFPTKTCCTTEKPYKKSINCKLDRRFLENVQKPTYRDGTVC